MAYRGYRKQGRAIPSLILAVGAWIVLRRSGPIIDGPEIGVVPVLAACVLVSSGLALIADVFRFAGDVVDWLVARKPTGLRGTAGWIKSLWEIRKDIKLNGGGPYWGVFKGQPLIADFDSSAYAIGPSGSGKSTKVIQTNALAIRSLSKTIVDFKSDLTPVLQKPLERQGERIRRLNIGGLHEDHVGMSDCYNPLCLVHDDLWAKHGLRDISDTLQELCLQLYPEPNGEASKDDNKYFRDGSRTLISFAIQTCVLIDGDKATLGDVLQLLNDRQSLLFHAQWAAGRLEQAEATQ